MSIREGRFGSIRKRGGDDIGKNTGEDVSKTPKKQKVIIISSHGGDHPDINNNSAVNEEKSLISKNPEIVPPLRAHFTENPSIKYLPMKYSDTDLCIGSWAKSQELGRGAFGSVFSACKSNTLCNYVMKVSDISTEDRYQMFQRDQHFLFLLKGRNIAPEIEDAWVCNDFGYIVMDKWDGDLLSTGIFTIHSQDGKMKIQEWAWLEMIRCLLELSKLKIVHGDVHEGNFLVKLAERKVCLSDYGTSIDYSKEVITDPKFIKMGWHYNRYLLIVNMYLSYTFRLACRTQKDFVEMYNLWNLEIRIRMLLKMNQKNALYIIRDDGTEYPFTEFENIPDSSRAQLDATCVIKPPKITRV